MIYVYFFQNSYRRMYRLTLILLSLLLLCWTSDAIKKKYLDSDMDGINDAEDDDDDNDGIDDEDDEDDDGNVIDDDEEDLDGDGILNKDDSDDDGDGVDDEFDNDDEGSEDRSRKGKSKASESGPWGSLVFLYFYGLTQYVLATA